MSELVVRCGRLSYRRLSTGEERGREDFTLTRNRDGSRTLRSVAWTRDSRFLRDATVSVDEAGRLLDAFIRLQVDEQWIGSGYFRGGSDLDLVVDRPDRRIVDRVTPKEGCHLMTHAVMHDGWTFWHYDRAVGRQELEVYNTSTKWNGTDGPNGRLETLIAERRGDESIQVAAGRFDTVCYRLHSPAIGSPPCELWVSEPDLLLVRYRWQELDLDYQLAELEETRA